MNEIAAVLEEREELEEPDQFEPALTKDFEVEKQRVLSAISGNSPKDSLK